MDTRIAGAGEDVGLHVVAAGLKKGRNKDWFRGGRTSECLEMMKGKFVNERKKKIWWIRFSR